MKVKLWARGGWYALSGVLAVGLLVSIAAGRSSGQAQPPTIKEVPCVAITSVEGQDNYQAYCAVCHGASGKGNGPAAPALKGPMPDLTTIAARHGGKFSQVEIERLISGADKRPAVHGSVTMPIWGQAFSESDSKVTTLRLQNLAKYLETIQQK